MQHEMGIQGHKNIITVIFQQPRLDVMSCQHDQHYFFLICSIFSFPKQLSELYLMTCDE